MAGVIPDTVTPGHRPAGAAMLLWPRRRLRQRDGVSAFFNAALWQRAPSDRSAVRNLQRGLVFFGGPTTAA